MLIPMTLTFDFENLLLLYSSENSVLKKKVTILHILARDFVVNDCGHWNRTFSNTLLLF